MFARSGAPAVRCAAKIALPRAQLAGPLRRVAAAAATRRMWSSRPVAMQLQPAGKGRSVPAGARTYASRSADEVMEEIEEQYGTAVDEFEIATEETEKMSVYAEEDRKAARKELDKLQAVFNEAIADASVREEITRRAGQRIRELSQAVANLEHLATEQD